MSKENRNVRLGTIRLFFDDDYRLVYYVLDSPSFWKRLFSWKGLLRRAYYCMAGMTHLFDPDEYKKVLGELKTYEDVKRWKDNQWEKARENRTAQNRAWNNGD